MSDSSINCPSCRSAVANSGFLGGIPVQCPICKFVFHLPEKSDVDTSQRFTPIECRDPPPAKRLRRPRFLTPSQRTAAIEFAIENAWKFLDLDLELEQFRALSDRQLLQFIDQNFEGGWAEFVRRNN